MPFNKKNTTDIYGVINLNVLRKGKEFSQKLVLFSLMFIVVSAVFPALFQSFVIVGSSFMQLDFLPVHVLLVIGVLFPLIDIAALFFIRSQTPHFLR